MKRLQLAWPLALGWLGYTPFLVCIIGIFILSNDPRPTIPNIFTFRMSDKFLHACAYAVVGAAALFGAWTSRPSRPLRSLAMEASAVGLLAGLGDEIHQSFVPNRLATIGDVVADSIGVLVGIFLLARLIDLSVGRTK